MDVFGDILALSDHSHGVGYLVDVHLSFAFKFDSVGQFLDIWRQPSFNSLQHFVVRLNLSKSFSSFTPLPSLSQRSNHVLVLLERLFVTFGALMEQIGQLLFLFFRLADRCISRLRRLYQLWDIWHWIHDICSINGSLRQNSSAVNLPVIIHKTRTFASLFIDDILQDCLIIIIILIDSLIPEIWSGAFLELRGLVESSLWRLGQEIITNETHLLLSGCSRRTWGSRSLALLSLGDNTGRSLSTLSPKFDS